MCIFQYHSVQLFISHLQSMHRYFSTNLFLYKSFILHKIISFSACSLSISISLLPYPISLSVSRPTFSPSLAPPRPITSSALAILHPPLSSPPVHFAILVTPCGSEGASFWPGPDPNVYATSPYSRRINSPLGPACIIGGSR